MRLPTQLASRGALPLALALTLAALGPRPVAATCTLQPDLNYMGLAIASTDATGRWSGRWLGAHPLACDGDTYVVAVTVADNWTALQQAATAPSATVYLIGDFPYIGDGTCVDATIRRWWQPGAVAPDGRALQWTAAAVPPTAPIFPCPLNFPGDAPLILQPPG